MNLSFSIHRVAGTVCREFIHTISMHRYPTVLSLSLAVTHHVAVYACTCKLLQLRLTLCDPRGL